MNENSSLNKRAALSTGFLILRQITINIINFLGNLILARILLPQDFGIYSLILYMITFFTLIGEGGLSAVIIRKKNVISEKLISTIFTFQQVLMGIITILFLIISYFIQPYLKNPDTIWLFRVSILSYFLLSFRIIQVSLLERNLYFGKIAFLEIMEVLSFQLTAVTLAFFNFGVWAMVLGLVMKNIVSLIIVFSMSIWKIKYRFDFKRLKPILPYGLSYQGSHFINFIKDSTVPMWIGSTLGMASLGFITWATTLANYPILIANMLSRVLFPFFSRLQQDKEKLKRAIEFVMRINLLFSMAIASILFGLAYPIIKILYTGKWLPALNLFYALILVNFLLGMVIPIVHAFNSIGKAFVTFKFSILWILYLWLFSLLLVPKYGIFGYGVGVVLTYLINIIYLMEAKKEFNINILKNILPQAICFILTVILLKFVQQYIVINNLFVLIIFIFIGIIFYFFFALIINGKQYYNDIKKFLRRE